MYLADYFLDGYSETYEQLIEADFIGRSNKFRSLYISSGIFGLTLSIILYNIL